jgi:Protein of unknown function (DUF4038)/Domain of unknown function (DUF5060)/Putative collagen-binding domain of a collagenase
MPWTTSKGLFMEFEVLAVSSTRGPRPLSVSGRNQNQKLRTNEFGPSPEALTVSQDSIRWPVALNAGVGRKTYPNRFRGPALWLGAACLALSTGPICAARRPPVVPKWSRFDHAFHSNVSYSHPLQEATLTVQFTSPLGEVYQVEGFWDGGKTWRVRFAPDQPGPWGFRSRCSDAGNHGLDGQTGRFLCTAPIGLSPFEQHGPVRVARDHRHFEYADGTPFFWLADTVWDGARLSTPKDWQRYAAVRAVQGFNVALWSATPGVDDQQQSPLGGFPDKVSVNPEVFQRLDAKLETLSRAGILSAIVPVKELAQPAAAQLTDSQAALVSEYLRARWGADPVAWLAGFDSADPARSLKRWRTIGSTVFAHGGRGPVVLRATPQTAKSTELQPAWVDALGVEIISGFDPESLSQSFDAGLAGEGHPSQPLLSVLPYENALNSSGKGRFTAKQVRRAAYWDLFLCCPPAGLCYGGEGVMAWDSTPESVDRKGYMASLPHWERALFMPAAKQMAHVATLMNSIPFWRVEPQIDAVVVRAGTLAPQAQILAAATPEKTLALAYLPEGRTVELALGALPASPNVSWLNPRTGETTPAVAVVTGGACQFPTPEPGDWVLVMRGGK